MSKFLVFAAVLFAGVFYLFGHYHPEQAKKVISLNLDAAKNVITFDWNTPDLKDSVKRRTVDAERRADLK